MKKKELKSMDKTGLMKRLSEIKKEIMIERGQLRASSRATNPGKLKSLKREAARITTILRQRNKYDVI
ncbi:50S ribosomal protein L29 [Candidatus Micrarchaeota archaeon]|nr:50S ribosomal protein L29 [Candidatus Micrarchaeota archaeon]